jgi:hypothetical protein
MNVFLIFPVAKMYENTTGINCVCVYSIVLAEWRDVKTIGIYELTWIVGKPNEMFYSKKSI